MPGRRDGGSPDGRVSERARFAVGGRRPALEAVRSGRATEVLVAERSRGTEGLRELLEGSRRAGIPVRRVSEQAIAGLVGDEHQGVAAVIERPKELDERALAALTFDEDALVVVLDGITDPQNFGASARSAEAAGAAVLITRERRAAPLTQAAMKASAGALLHLPVARVTNLRRTLDALKDRGFFVAGLDEHGEDLWRAPVRRPLAVVAGAEGEGLSRLVRESCDVLVAIPLRGRTTSLNASAALSVGLFGYADRPEGAATMPGQAGVAQSGSASDL
jgi:23S rRNA (guanosine2251-2'-O)-methyltransferase